MGRTDDRRRGVVGAGRGEVNRRDRAATARDREGARGAGPTATCDRQREGAGREALAARDQRQAGDAPGRDERLQDRAAVAAAAGERHLHDLARQITGSGIVDGQRHHGPGGDDRGEHDARARAAEHGVARHAGVARASVGDLGGVERRDRASAVEDGAVPDPVVVVGVVVGDDQVLRAGLRRDRQLTVRCDIERVAGGRDRCLRGRRIGDADRGAVGQEYGDVLLRGYIVEKVIDDGSAGWRRIEGGSGIPEGAEVAVVDAKEVFRPVPFFVVDGGSACGLVDAGEREGGIDFPARWDS